MRSIPEIDAYGQNDVYAVLAVRLPASFPAPRFYARQSRFLVPAYAARAFILKTAKSALPAPFPALGRSTFERQIFPI